MDPSSPLDPVSADEFLGTIEEMTMLEAMQEKYFTAEQLPTIKARREQVGHEYLGRMQETWAELIALTRMRKYRPWPAAGKTC